MWVTWIACGFSPLAKWCSLAPLIGSCAYGKTKMVTLKIRAHTPINTRAIARTPWHAHTHTRSHTIWMGFSLSFAYFDVKVCHRGLLCCWAERTCIGCFGMSGILNLTCFYSIRFLTLCKNTYILNLTCFYSIGFLTLCSFIGLRNSWSWQKCSLYVKLLQNKIYSLMYQTPSTRTHERAHTQAQARMRTHLYMATLLFFFLQRGGHNDTSCCYDVIASLDLSFLMTLSDVVICIMYSCIGYLFFVLKNMIYHE